MATNSFPFMSKSAWPCQNACLTNSRPRGAQGWSGTKGNLSYGHIVKTDYIHICLSLMILLYSLVNSIASGHYHHTVLFIVVLLASCCLPSLVPIGNNGRWLGLRYHVACEDGVAQFMFISSASGFFCIFEAT